MRAGHRFLPAVFLAAALTLSPLWAVGAAAAQPSSPLRGGLGPTYVFPDNSTLYVIFRFGAWTRLAYNGSQAVAPLVVYFHSASGIPAVIRDNYNHSVTVKWGLALNVSTTGKPYELTVKYRGRVYHFVFKIVRAIQEKRKEKTITLTLSAFRSWLDREAQAATLLSVAGIVAAVVLKRRLLLLSVFNVVNASFLFTASMLVYVIASRLGHSPWLVVPLVLSFAIGYRVYPVGRRVMLVWFSPSLRRILLESVVLYRTLDGKLAVAKQSVGSALKRLFGRHIYLVDAELKRVGEFPPEKLWVVEDVNAYEKMEGIVVLDAELRKARVRLQDNVLRLEEEE